LASGRGGEEKNSQPLLGLEPPIIQPVAISLSYPGSKFNTLYFILRGTLLKGLNELLSRLIRCHETP
jgi:hypothetical protein